MGDPALAELVAAAEAGDARFPDNPLTGLRGEAERLDNAERMIFAEDETVPEIFGKLTDLSADSPLAPRAKRLRLLRNNREKLRTAMPPDNPCSGRLFAVLATGPGPTMAKHHFEESLTERADFNAVVALRRTLALDAPAVYAGERAWLKKVGPGSGVTRLERFTDALRAGGSKVGRNAPIVIAIILLLGLCLILILGGAAPVGGIIFAVAMFLGKRYMT